MFDFAIEGWGLFHEADAVAKDILAGRQEDAIMPLKEALVMMKLLDTVRENNGLRYPQDE